jgi:hypothetical protein
MKRLHVLFKAHIVDVFVFVSIGESIYNFFFVFCLPSSSSHLITKHTALAHSRLVIIWFVGDFLYRHDLSAQQPQPKKRIRAGRMLCCRVLSEFAWKGRRDRIMRSPFIFFFVYFFFIFIFYFFSNRVITARAVFQSPFNFLFTTQRNITSSSQH